MAPGKILKSMMFATAALSICFIFDGSSPLHAQGAYQPGYGGTYQPGYGGTYQPGYGGAYQPGR